MMGCFKSVYIVDDDIEGRTSLTFLLSSAGYFARPSGGGVAFLADVDNSHPAWHKPDLAVDRVDSYVSDQVAGHEPVESRIEATLATIEALATNGSNRTDFNNFTFPTSIQATFKPFTDPIR